MSSSKLPDAGSATVMIDFSNGVTTTVTGVALAPDGGLWATLARPSIGSRPPRLTFDEGMVDRGGNHRTHIVAIDGVASVLGETVWSIWVNDRPAGSEIRYHMEDLPGGGNPSPAVQDGDFVLLKLERPKSEESNV